MKRYIGLGLILCVSNIWCMNTDMPSGGITEQMYVTALEDILGVNLPDGVELLYYVKDVKKDQGYRSFLQDITTRGKKRSHKDLKALYKALIQAQSDHTQMLGEQIAQTNALANRSALSTKKALQTARYRLYAAVCAGTVGAVSLLINILQAVGTIS